MILTFPEEDFSFRKQYVRVLDGDSGDHCVCLINQRWVEALIKANRRSFTLDEPESHPILSDIEVSLLLNQQSSSQIKPPWTRIELFRVNLSPGALVSRFRGRTQTETSGTSTEPVKEDLVNQLQDEIQFSSVQRRYSKSIQGILEEEDFPEYEVASDVIRALCTSVLHCPFLDFSGQSSVITRPKTLANIVQPIFVASVMDHFVIALPFRPFTLASCLRFSPALLFCDAAKYFVLYQAFQAVSRFQEQDFFVGKIILEDFDIREDLWLELNPVTVFRNLAKLQKKKSDELFAEKKTFDPDENSNEICKIIEWTTLWCLGKISNYDYLLALNHAAGRTFGHPDYHPIFPWVVDFTSPDGGWRDLTKSKYRLTKGDRQLDLTYEAAEQGMVAHHIPETFSDLTFYIYNARRVPKSILCQHVRKRWVPAEYPSTLERLYKWSPDECIPEFYSDPEIFLSIHEDLPDLGLPHWCETVEQFLHFHKDALESQYVTNNLHHWIDLNFGYKLSGEAAVAAKNVVLSLRIPQKHLKSHGIQQLFNMPHPPAFRTSPWYKRGNPPLLYPRKTKRKDTSGDNVSVSSLDLGDDVTVEPDSPALFKIDEPAEMGPIDELVNLESLMDFCMSVDGEQPMILADYLPEKSQFADPLQFLRTDLHSLACLALQIFCVEHGTANWPEITDLQEHLLYSSRRLAALEANLSSSLVVALQDLLNPNVHPYNAMQIISQSERIFPFPDYVPNLYQFVASLDVRANLDALEDVLEEIGPTDMNIISIFVRQRLTSAPDRYKFAFLLLEPVFKYFGPAKSAEFFLPCLNRLFSDFTASSSQEHSAYLKLFDIDFLRRILIRLGGEIFMRSVTVPLIEKLTDLHDLVNAGRVKFSLGVGFAEDIFSVDVEEKEEDLASSSLKSEDSAQSVAFSTLIWLADKVGPLLTARFISGNLLKSLALCYVEDERLKSIDLSLDVEEDCIQRWNVVGDVAAWVVSDALVQIAALFGHCFVWDQYFSYCAELTKDALRRLSPMNEAGLLGCMELVSQILPHLTDTTLLEHLPFQIINEILYPVVELLTSFAHIFPSGVPTRRLLTVKWLNLVFCLANRIGRDAAKDLITRPLLVTFFGIFTQLYGPLNGQTTATDMEVPQTFTGMFALSDTEAADHPFGSPFITIRKDAESGELTVGTPVRISAMDSLPSSPTPPVNPRSAHTLGDSEEVLIELKAVFTETLAFDAYIPFCKLLGQFHMDDTLLNNDLLHEIFISNPNHVPQKVSSQSLQIPQSQRATSTAVSRSQSAKFDAPRDLGNGSNLSRSLALTSSAFGFGTMRSMSDTGVSGQKETPVYDARDVNNDRTLRGNWLAYWQHELGQGRRDEPWNIKQIPLQTFSAHSGPVKSICVLDCEDSFMTASKDKTVRLWSIRNSGDGTVVSQAEGHYLDHKRPVCDIRFLGRERLAASCDGVVNLWDPWTLATVSRIEVVSQANLIDCAAVPSSVLFVGHVNEETCLVSRFDVRCRMGPSGTGQFQVSPNSAGIMRCLVVSPDDTWFACGFSSGIISVFDQRTGVMSATWKPYESDVLQLIPVSGSILASIGSDSTVFLWDLKREVDDRLVGSVRGFPEPIVHAAFAARNSGGDLIALMANNRVGVYADLLRDGSAITTSKIRHDSLKGNFSTLCVLPINRQLLVANENGSTLLMC